MNFYSVFILSQLAIFPFLFAIIKSKYSNEINKLNIFFVVSYITECITTILIKAKLYDYSSIPGNLYILISCILLITFFIDKKSKEKYFIIIFFTILWLIDNKIIHNLNERN